MGIRPLNRSKSNSYTEPMAVNAAGRWRERNVWYPGRSYGRDQGSITSAVTVEIRFAVRSQQKPKYRLGYRPDG